MVAITVLAILSAGVISLIGRGPGQSARDARRKADLEKIASALELYRNDRGGYATAGNYACVGALPCLMNTFITSPLPTDPQSGGGSYRYTPGTCGGTTCRTYTLCADLEKVAGPFDYCITNP